MIPVFSRVLARSIGLGLICLLTAGVAQAQLNSGSGILSGKEKLKVSRCGKDGGIVIAEVTVANGMWTLSTSGLTYSGSLLPADSKGRKFNASFDTSSRALLISTLTNWASDLCGASITNIQIEFQKSQLKVGKKLDKAKIILKIRATGQISGGEGKASYSLKLKGPFAGI